MVGRIIIAIILVSLTASLLGKLFGYSALAKYIGAPALALSGWAALGHLLTLDDDAPGEWSNPEGKESVWRHSLVELSLKVIIFVVVGIAIYA